MACTNQTCIAHREWNERLEAEARALRAEVARLERELANAKPAEDEG